MKQLICFLLAGTFAMAMCPLHVSEAECSYADKEVKAATTISEPVQKVVVQKVHTLPAPVEVETEPSYIKADIPLPKAEQEMLYDACEEFGVPYELALAVIWRETRYQNIMGDNGASAGYMQIQRRWWSGLMDEIGATDLNVPKDNFRTGCAIIAQLTEKYGSVESALTAYNTGKPGKSKYATAVLEYMNANA